MKIVCLMKVIGSSHVDLGLCRGEGAAWSWLVRGQGAARTRAAGMPAGCVQGRWAVRGQAAWLVQGGGAVCA